MTDQVNKMLAAVVEALAEWVPTPKEVAEVAAMLPDEMHAYPQCETCSRFDDDLGEDGDCEECRDERHRKEIAYWQPLYEAEKAAGLLKSREEYEADLRDAGRMI